MPREDVRRVNVQVRDGVDPADALVRVATVMQGGRISGGGTCYCWTTSFADGLVVATRTTRGGRQNSDSFVVYKEKEA